MACGSIPPLQLPWRNVSISSEGAFARGIAIEVGNPPQILSLRPTTRDFDSWVFDVADCVTSSNYSCTAGLGGAFSPDKSSTFTQTTQARWNGTNEPALNEGDPFTFFNDEIYVGDTGAIPGFPLLTDLSRYAEQSGLALGQNSTFLQAVVDAGLAPSKEWSIWVGSRSIEDPIDGLVIVGGFDENRAMGTPAAFNSYNDCSMFLNITNMSWNSDTGSSSLMANSSDMLFACVDSYYTSLDLRYDMYDKFGAFTGGTYDPDTESWTYPRSNPPVGNLTVTLDGGYTTIIPASELFLPPRGWDKTGSYIVTNDSILSAEVSNLTDPNYYALFGFPFMTMNYFVIDWENYDFVMTPANRTSFDNNDIAQKISPLCPSSTATKPSKPTGPLTASPTTKPPSTSSTAPASSSSSNSTTAIIGGVVGCVLGLALVGSLLAFFLIRNRRKTRLQQQKINAHAPAYETGHDDATISTYRYSTKPAASIMTDTTHTYTDADVSELPSASGDVQERTWVNSMKPVPEDQHEGNFTATSGPVEMPALHYQ